MIIVIMILVVIVILVTIVVMKLAEAVVEETQKRLWHRFFPVNFVKFLRIPFFIEHLWWLL